MVDMFLYRTLIRSKVSWVKCACRSITCLNERYWWKWNFYVKTTHAYNATETAWWIVKLNLQYEIHSLLQLQQTEPTTTKTSVKSSPSNDHNRKSPSMCFMDYAFKNQITTCAPLRLRLKGYLRMKIRFLISWQVNERLFLVIFFKIEVLRWRYRRDRKPTENIGASRVKTKPIWSGYIKNFERFFYTFYESYWISKNISNMWST